MRRGVVVVFVLIVGFLLFSSIASAQPTKFTYSGQLLDSAVAANGSYDIEFSLWDSLVDGVQIGSTQTLPGVAVTKGIFTVTLDFGTVFSGAGRFLQIAVRPAGTGSYVTLAPRQEVTSAPYSVRSAEAGSANSALSLNGIPWYKFVLEEDPRLSDARAPLAGSSNYIQNQNSVVQLSTNFNIQGSGSAGSLNAVTEYNLGGVRILGNSGSQNLFAGVGAGAVTTGGFNAFFGAGAGAANTTGFANSFFGASAGSNSTGSSNSFFGRGSGSANTTASDNTFAGAASGAFNTTGGANSFFGSSAGLSNVNGTENSFFGRETGSSNTGGSYNSFVGRSAGVNNTTGNYNVFLGTYSGQTNVSGSYNTTVGSLAYADGQAYSYATAIGAQAVVTESNRIQLGRNGLDTVRIGQLASITGTRHLCINANQVLSECYVPPSVQGESAQNSLSKTVDDMGSKIGEQRRAIEDLDSKIKEQDRRIKAQRAQIEALIKLVCAQNASASVCKESL